MITSMNRDSDGRNRQLPSVHELINWCRPDQISPKQTISDNEQSPTLSYVPTTTRQLSDTFMGNFTEPNYTGSNHNDKLTPTSDMSNITIDELIRYLESFTKHWNKMIKFSQNFCERYHKCNKTEMIKFIQTISTSELDIQIDLHEQLIKLLQAFKQFGIKSCFKTIPNKLPNTSRNALPHKTPPRRNSHPGHTSKIKMHISGDSKLMTKVPKMGGLNIELSKKHRIVCQHCGSKETPEWRRGPQGSRTLCNACGLFYSKLTKRYGMKHADEVMAYRKTAGTVNDRRV